MPTPKEEDRSKNPLYNRELLKQIMMGSPSAVGEEPAAVDTPPPPPAIPAPSGVPAPGSSASGKKGISWSEVAPEAIKNLGPSLVGVGESMVAPIVHPIDTATAMYGLGKGAYSKAKGALGYEQEPAQKAKEEASLNAVVDFYKQRYGTEAGFKEALAKDPAGVAADLSTFLTGGGSAMARLPGKIAKVGEVAQYVGKAGPIGEAVGQVAETAARGAAKAVTTPTSALFAFTAGKPFKTMQDAAQAGFEMNPEFIRHLTGEGTPEEIVNRLEDAISVLENKRSNEYISGLKDPMMSQTPLGYGKIDNAILNSESMFKSLGKNYQKKAALAYEKAKSIVDEWKNQPQQAGAHSINDMDKLKRALGELHSDYSREFGANDPASKVVSDIRRSVFDTIKEHDPRYAEAMEKYAEMSEKIKNIRSEVLGKEKAPVGSKIRKIFSGGKSKDYKKELISELESIDPDIGYVLAGHELSELIPQGKVAKIAAGIKAGLAGYGVGSATAFSPLTLLGAPAFSPALAGATQYALGAATGLPAKMPPGIPYAVGEMREREKERPGRATGGKVARGMTPDMIIAAIKRAHNHGKNETEDMLNLPDESVAKALDIAKRGI